jgi:transcriptional regulator with XRE-family HTH domain
MVIGERVKVLSDQRNMSQGDIQKRTGLLRCYVSRVENGHAIPSIDTLERLAQELELPMHRFYTDNENVK